MFGFFTPYLPVILNFTFTLRLNTNAIKLTMSVGYVGEQLFFNIYKRFFNSSSDLSCSHKTASCETCFAL